MDLSGKWSFQLDPEDKGINEQWYKHSLAGSIYLPGSLQAQGFGEEVSVDTQWTGRPTCLAAHSSTTYSG